MKPLTITGIAQETPLDNPDESYIYLVFNHGECRVPTNEAGVQAVMQALSEGVSEEVAAPGHPDLGAGVEVFSGPSSEDPRLSNAVPTNEEWLAQQAAAEESDDGDYEVNDGVGSI